MFRFALLSLMPLFQHRALIVDADSILRVSFLDLIQENRGFYRHSRAYHQTRRTTYEPAGYESKMILFPIVKDRVTCVRSISSSNAYVGFVLQGQVGSYLASRGRLASSFPSSPKKPPTITVQGNSISERNGMEAE